MFVQLAAVFIYVDSFVIIEFCLELDIVLLLATLEKQGMKCKQNTYRWLCFEEEEFCLQNLGGGGFQWNLYTFYVISCSELFRFRQATYQQNKQVGK